ncbi:flocculation protein FLO11-like [Maniola jurtina]|uniref:flocculation protein FLO11-like n=1 Tax=Maniola jurtina TaxID=191418 RepID=UPI001E688993|nr:flocculation protein FLO11-like [Maniola jurtina]XP_045764988.1 flocculation protein FLO11-like [Maniola jurtina]
MRRQARISAGGTLVARSASALQVWLWLLLFVFQNEFRISRSIQPGYLDFDNLPDTNFTCAGKVIGGYYADLETSCQMFHVCTVGQQEEPMDIKFLCLNGTVFDQETRVCERVDEVDCTKSEKFYSLNLELYGSTTPPIIQAEPTKPQPKSTERTHLYSKPSSTTENSNPVISTTPDKSINHPTDPIDSTEDPIQESKKDEYQNTSTYPSSSSPSKQQEIQHVEEYEEEDDAIDDENSDYEEDYSHPQTTTTVQTITTTSATTKRPSTSTTLLPSTKRPTPATHLISSPSPSISSLSPPIHASLTPSAAPPSSTIDPSLLSPQEFIYRHRGPGSEAISFQRQSFRPADGVYITHAPPHQYDHFQYESSRTAPRPVVNRPVPFVQRPQPTPFRPTTIDPRDQILRPGPNAQSSEKLETPIKIRPQSHHSHLPVQQPLPFNPFYYDRKRSDDGIPEDESSLSARSVAPPTITARRPSKPKSPPRVIVTASASVSDSNGKKLNYTVGNVVSAVKPIVAINYDDYKESDLIFDPFFLDVPKLQSRRKTRSSKYRKVVIVPVPAPMSDNIMSEKISPTTFSPVTSRATTTKLSSTTLKSTTTVAWNPQDYVDDNYEPHAYIPPVPPLAVLVTQDQIKFKNQERSSKNDVVWKKLNEVKSANFPKEPTKLTSSVAHTISSQSVGTEATVAVTSPTPIEAPACITSRSTDCRIRA